jgi:RimJ/RimL family protein N-acetyltransferase
MVYRINDVHATRLIMKHCRTTFQPGSDWSVARYDSKDCLMGGFIINNYNGPGGSLQLHVCSFRPRWASKGLLYLAFNFPFKQLGVKKIVGLVPEANLPAFNLDLHLGFKVEAIITDIYPFKPSGCIVMGMYAQDCRWLNMDPPVIVFAERERMSEMPVLH